MLHDLAHLNPVPDEAHPNPQATSLTLTPTLSRRGRGSQPVRYNAALTRRSTGIHLDAKPVERRGSRRIQGRPALSASTPRVCSAATSRWCCTAAATPRSSCARRNLVGDEEEILYVKGSGWDLETIEEAGFSPVRMAHLAEARAARGAEPIRRW